MNIALISKRYFENVSGITDIVQVLMNGLMSAIFSLCLSTANFVLSKICGAILMGGWYATSILGAFLAINRLFAVASPFAADQFFKGRRTYIWLSIGFTCGAGLSIFYLCNGVDMLYYTESYIWFYSNSTMAVAAEHVNISIDIITGSVIIICNVGVAITLKVRLLLLGIYGRSF